MTLLQITGWTLVHFLWQGAIVVVAFAIFDAALRNSSAKLRYAVASTAMLMMLACAAATMYVLASVPDPGLHVASTDVQPGVTASATMTRIGRGPESLPSNYLFWLVYLWMAGVTALSVRMAVQWLRVEQFRRRGIRTLDDAWQERIDRIAVRLQLRRTVRAYESAVADVPSVIGWIRPVVLVPASALLQLSPGMVEALLAHELAHVRRHDYLINLLQSCVETLFFYHPGVWWVGHRMRQERENCCDDLAVEVCGDPIVYARALADLEQSRNGMPEFAMAANTGSLLNRIQRLVAPRPQKTPKAPMGATLITLALAAVFVWAAPQASSQAQGQIRQPEPAVRASQAPKPSTPTSQPAKPRAAQPAPTSTQESYIDQLQGAGYRNLTADQLISMKIHGVTPEFIAEIKSLGWSPTPDELIAFRVHGVNTATLGELRALGYTLTPDQAVAARVHGLTAAYVNDWKQKGLKELTFDNLIALRVHGADPSSIDMLKALGINELSADNIVSLRVHGVTPDFIREAQKYGFSNLKLEQIIQLKRLGIVGSQDRK